TYDIYKHKDDLLNYKCSSCLCGKRIFDPLPQEKIDILLERKEAPKEYVKFITGMDKNGNKIEWPCGARNTLHRDSKFLAKVSFKKQVLGKYDNETSKYSVEDGSISCGALWHLTIDNYHKEDGLIYVYLGDLGVLPHKEQLYWKSYNVLPSEEISDIRWKRDFECEFTDSEQPDHAFIEKYRNLQKVCEKELGWQLLLPLNKNDEYLLKRIRIPSVNEQHIFDGLILDMAKILIDSINGGKIDVLLSEEQKKESKEFKGNKKILKLEKLLENCLLDNINKTRIEFLHDLQKVRSQGSAHRKSDKYKNLLNKFNKINDSLVDTATNILQKSISVLDFFIKAIPSIKTYQEKLKTQNKC
ncbi:MAG: hypothetical protein LBM19_03435, partial [Holosporales bacterium]|nr:hypothetical protein [Holosporales bacterium]